MFHSGGLRSKFTVDDLENSTAATSGTGSFQPLNQRGFTAACTYLRSAVIGRRKLIYADFTASGRALNPIENFIAENVLPYYGNTHTMSTTTGSQSTFYRIEARQIVKQYLNATHEHALIFCGSGSTAAITKFICIMERTSWNIASLRTGQAVEDRWGSYECSICGIRLSSEIIAVIYQTLYRAHVHSNEHKQRSEKHQVSAGAGTNSESQQQQQQQMINSPSPVPLKPHRRLIVFLCDPTAHHSLSLPFRELRSASGESEFLLVDLRLDPGTCRCDESHLEAELRRCVELKRAVNSSASLSVELDVVPIVLLNAASNVTGLHSHFPHLNRLIHFYGGLACWDFAAAVGHVDGINFSTPDPTERPDVGFFSPHKLLGGPGCPGFLVIRKSLLSNEVPAVPGGGVVFFVSAQDHSYIHNTEEREEAGTPDILGDIRAGLLFRLYSQLSVKHIAERENAFAEYLIKTWLRHRRIEILGPCNLEDTNILNKRTGIVSFMIRYGNVAAGGSRGLYLHHHFVVALLNDLFGIQSRGGCACAGPLAQKLLGLSSAQVSEYEQTLQQTGQEVMRPGFIRISLNFSLSWDDIDMIARAVMWVADFGWQLLSSYTFVPETGEWFHRVVRPSSRRKWLSDIQFNWGGETRSSAAIPPASLAKEETKRPSQATKDPKKIAGAVSLMGGSVDSKEFAMCIQNTLSSLRKTGEVGRQAMEEMSKQRFKDSDVIKTRAVNAVSTKLDDPVPKTDAPQSIVQQRLLEISSRERARQQVKRTLPTAASGTAIGTIPATASRSACILPSTSTMASTVATQGSSGSPVAERAVASFSTPDNAPSEFEELIMWNNKILDALISGSEKKISMPTASSLIPSLPEQYLHLIWFALPIDAAYSLSGDVPLVAPCLEDIRPTAACFNILQEYTTSQTGSIPGKLSVEAPIQLSEEEVRLLTVKDEGKNTTKNVFDFLKLKLTTISISGDMCKVYSTPDVIEATTVTPDITGESTALSPDESATLTAAPEQSDGDETGRVTLVIPRQLRHLCGSAVRGFDMIREGDRLLLGLSGGKDSLTLLHVLRDMQKRAPIRFELAAATVDPQTPEYNPRPLINYLARLSVPYHFLSYPIIDLAKVHMQKNSICAFCSRMKRGILYSCMRKFNYNVLVLGQHLDDVCESFLMSAFHNGSLNTMKAHYTIQKKDIRVCRPLIFTREKLLAQFAKDNNLPVIADNCPACFSQPKERHRIKILLSQQEFNFPHIFQNLLRSVQPLMAITEVGTEHIHQETTVPDSVEEIIEEINRGEYQPPAGCANTEDLDLRAEQMLTACAVNEMCNKNV